MEASLQLGLMILEAQQICDSAVVKKLFGRLAKWLARDKFFLFTEVATMTENMALLSKHLHPTVNRYRSGYASADCQQYRPIERGDI